MKNEENGCNGNRFNCNDENRERELDLQPIEIQAQVWASMRRTAQLEANARTIVDSFKTWEKFMDELDDFTWTYNPDKAEVLALLFTAAEYFDALEEPVDTPDGQQPLYKEQAKEFDWIRHVFIANPDLFPAAVRIIFHIPNFGHDPKDAELFKDDREFRHILSFWSELNNK